MEIDRLAANLAHEICNEGCFAYTGSDHKPHSAQCQNAERTILDAIHKICDPIQAKLDTNCAVGSQTQRGRSSGCTTATHTVAELEVSAAAYDEIAGLLRDASYDHAFDSSGLIDMSGIGLTRCEPERQPVSPADADNLARPDSGRRSGWLDREIANMVHGRDAADDGEFTASSMGAANDRAAGVYQVPLCDCWPFCNGIGNALDARCRRALDVPLRPRRLSAVRDWRFWVAIGAGGVAIPFLTFLLVWFTRT